MRPVGKFFCPRCMCRELFCLTPDAKATEDLPDLECMVCEYTFTTLYIEHVNGPAEEVHSLGKDARIMAAKALREEFTKEIAAMGYPLENMTQPTRRATRANYGK